MGQFENTPKGLKPRTHFRGAIGPAKAVPLLQNFVTLRGQEIFSSL